MRFTSLMLSIFGIFAVTNLSWAGPGKPGKWMQLKETTRCEATQNDYCVGYYSFLVEKGGQYMVGPDSGVAVVGQLTPAEYKMIDDDANHVSRHISEGPDCDQIDGVPGTSDVVDMIFGLSSSVRVYDQNGTFGRICYQGGEQRVEKLHADLKALMEKYYPRPFP